MSGGPGAGEGWARVLAPAKLTLRLKITGVRDDGYHLIDAEMLTVDLFDILEIGPGDGLVVSGPPLAGIGEAVSVGEAAGAGEAAGVGEAAGAGEATVAVAAGDDNLVRRALRAVGLKAMVRLDKRIPVGAGLGGGSADAAAVLRWAGCSDLEVAGGLGADVPFCLVGGRARVTGVGEVVEGLDSSGLAGRAWTLLTPPVFVSTPAVYAAWDRLGGPESDGPNDLSDAALAVSPSLAGWRDELGSATGETPVLAGSGSTWWVPGSHPGEGRVVVRACDPPPVQWGTGGSADLRIAP